MAARRAFIAAPLVGTILFLTAIIYSMNLIRTEEQAAARISDDAYHNKVVSLLALYKADLLSMFSDGLRQNVEDFLIAVDWRGINDVPNLTVSGRLSRCSNSKMFMRDGVISSGATIGSDFNSQTGTHLSGLSDLLIALRQPYNFEGILFEPVGFPPFPLEADSSRSVGPDFACNQNGAGEGGHLVCEMLVPIVAYDCGNFAENLVTPHRCCTFGQDGSCAEEIRGCENGNFFLIANLSNPDVFKAMPRIQAKDSYGNIIRTSVLGDREFKVPIRIPIFRYYDASFRLYAFQQFYPQRNEPWPVANATAAPSGISWHPSSLDAEDYVDSLVQACRFFRQDNRFKGAGFNISMGYYTGYGASCSNGILSYTTPSGNSRSALVDYISNRAYPDSNPTGDIFIVDYDPRFRVNPEKENSLQVSHNLSYG
jgi:hypothetical protein